PEEVIAEQAPQHVEDDAAFLIEVAVEEVDWGVVDVADDGPAVIRARLAKVAVELVLESVAVLIEAFVVLVPDQLEGGREAFVEPAMRPVTAGKEVAEPRVGELVGDRILRALVLAGAGGV